MAADGLDGASHGVLGGTPPLIAPGRVPLRRLPPARAVVRRQLLVALPVEADEPGAHVVGGVLRLLGSLSLLSKKRICTAFIIYLLLFMFIDQTAHSMNFKLQFHVILFGWHA